MLAHFGAFMQSSICPLSPHLSGMMRFDLALYLAAAMFLTLLMRLPR
jgi:hypothetical protein